MVYFRHKDGSFEALDAINQGQTVYYKYEDDDEPFPEVRRASTWLKSHELI